jgi:hypothetical protein
MKNKKTKPLGRPKLPTNQVKKAKHIRVSDDSMKIIYDCLGMTIQEFVDNSIDQLRKHHTTLKKHGLV